MLKISTVCFFCDYCIFKGLNAPFQSLTLVYNKLVCIYGFVFANIYTDLSVKKANTNSPCYTHLPITMWKYIFCTDISGTDIQKHLTRGIESFSENGDFLMYSRSGLKHCMRFFCLWTVTLQNNHQVLLQFKR